MISLVTTARITPQRLREAEYWVSNLVSPVNFNSALTKVAGQFKATTMTLVEVGPHSTL